MYSVRGVLNIIQTAPDNRLFNLIRNRTTPTCFNSLWICAPRPALRLTPCECLYPGGVRWRTSRSCVGLSPRTRRSPASCQNLRPSQQVTTKPQSRGLLVIPDSDREVGSALTARCSYTNLRLLWYDHASYIFLLDHKMAAASTPDAAASLVLPGIKNLLDHLLVFTVFIKLCFGFSLKIS